MKKLKYASQIGLYTMIFLALTFITQIGGVVFLLSIVLSHFFKANRWKSYVVFLLIYLLSTFVIVPNIAPIFGREPLPIRGQLRPLNVMTCLLNRHYTSHVLKSQLLIASATLNSEYPGTKTQYLDANFPFINGFPLLPHLSHDDGKKIDLAFYYLNSSSRLPVDGAPSFIGYGSYDSPLSHEVDIAKKCRDQGHWQYGILSYFVPKWDEKKYVVDKKRTKSMIVLLANNQHISKLFIEPHLKSRWQLQKLSKIRFHGCRAVRHDDHIHLQTN